jgi:hypothetical protein
MGILHISLRRTRGDNSKAILVGLALACCVLSVLAAYLFLGRPLDQGRRDFASPTAALVSPVSGRLPTLPIQPRTNIISRMNSSPDGSYLVIEEHLGDHANIIVKNRSGLVVVGDLVARNGAQIGMNRKFECQCDVSFAGWMSSANFVINISNALGEQFEFIVDARTGLVDEKTFRRVQ